MRTDIPTARWLGNGDLEVDTALLETQAGPIRAGADSITATSRVMQDPKPIRE